MASPKKVFELRRDRAKLLHDARAVTDGAAELRSLTGEDQHKIDKIFADIDALDKLITAGEKILSLEDSLGAGPERRSAAPEFGRTNPEGTLYESAEYRSAFAGWLGSGQMVLPAEYRDLTLAAPANGGAMVTPVQLAKDIIQVVL